MIVDWDSARIFHLSYFFISYLRNRPNNPKLNSANSLCQGIHLLWRCERSILRQGENPGLMQMRHVDKVTPTKNTT